MTASRGESKPEKEEEEEEEEEERRRRLGLMIVNKGWQCVDEKSIL
jgi:hypothetical protein